MTTTEWYLCADGGGTAVKVVVASSDGRTASAAGGPCNIKSVGVRLALSEILRTTRKALAQTPSLELPFDAHEDDPRLPIRFFARVWLGLAGVGEKSDADGMRSLAGDAFGFAVDDPALRITNDGHLLAAASLTLPDIETTIALVAGTGSIGLAFRKTADGAELNLVGVSGGWGYLLGDGGSGYDVARIALCRYLADNDARTTASLAQPTAAAPPLPPLYTALLASLGVGNATELIEQVYDSSTLESERKVRLARSAQVVLDHAFPANAADALASDQELALSILQEAVAPLVMTVMRLTGEGEHSKPDSTLLALGGGMWRSSGYADLLLRGLAERGIVVPKVRVVHRAAEDGVKALMAMGESRV